MMMAKVPLLKRFFVETKGGTAIEYALIAAFISIAIVAPLLLIGPKLKGYYEKIKFDTN
jgi:Flp pilus assembly pilin Flp